MANDLTKASLDGNSTKVAIGTPVITNDKSKNSDDIKKLMGGGTLTAPDLESFEAIGLDGLQVGRDDNSDSFDFSTAPTTNIDKSVQWSFDSENGNLVFVRNSGDVSYISGFLRQIDFGVGPTGPRGNPGKDGKDGREGKEGKDGPTGCQGKIGLEGRQGDVGEDGEEGPPGPQGLVGPPGATGPQGEQGKQGLPGMEGRRGPKGFTCPTSLRGPTGPRGRAMNEYVGVGNAPGPTDLIWAAPDDCLCAFDPAKVEFQANIAPTLVYEFRQPAPPIPCPAGQTKNGAWHGQAYLDGTMLTRFYSDGSVVNSDYDYGGASCAIERYKAVYTHTGYGYGMNIAKCFNNPTIVGDYTFINEGMIGGAAGVASLHTGSFPAGSTLTIINKGTICGIGGKGGWYNANGSNTPPSAGGDALVVEFPVTIDNTYGIIAGGGGGGGGSAEWGGKNDNNAPGGGGAGIPAGDHGPITWRPGYTYDNFEPATETTGGWCNFDGWHIGVGGDPGAAGGQGAIVGSDYAVYQHGAAAGSAIIGMANVVSLINPNGADAVKGSTS